MLLFNELLLIGESKHDSLPLLRRGSVKYDHLPITAFKDLLYGRSIDREDNSVTLKLDGVPDSYMECENSRSHINLYQKRLSYVSLDESLLTSIMEIKNANEGEILKKISIALVIIKSMFDAELLKSGLFWILLIHRIMFMLCHTITYTYLPIIMECQQQGE